MTLNATGRIFRLKNGPNPFIKQLQRSGLLVGQKAIPSAQQQYSCQKCHFRERQKHS